MNKFKRSWLLFKTSIAVIQQNKRLLVFPILTLGFTFLILLFFITPVVFQPTGYHVNQPEHWKAVGGMFFVEQTTATPGGGEASSTTVSLKPAGMVGAVLVYFVSMLLATFFNVAFYSEIIGALKGQPVSIRRGLAFANTKWKPILMWTLFAGLIGLLIRQIEERVGFLARFIVSLIGTAWSVACIFVIPVLVCDEATVNPLQILKKSALTLKKTWGESLIGYAGIQFGGVLVMFASLLLLGGAVVISIMAHTFWIIAVAAVLWLFAIIAWSYVIGVASQVYRCALFLYASEGLIAEPYNRELLDMAWKTRKG